MKRIIAALQGKVEKMKMERKIARVNRAIESATDNARDAIDRLEEEKANLLASMAGDSEVGCLINSISEKIGQQEEQEAIIARLEKVRLYIDEEVAVEEEKK